MFTSMLINLKLYFKLNNYLIIPFDFKSNVLTTIKIKRFKLIIFLSVLLFILINKLIKELSKIF